VIVRLSFGLILVLLRICAGALAPNLDNMTM
jgi:hypothetical protein